MNAKEILMQLSRVLTETSNRLIVLPLSVAPDTKSWLFNNARDRSRHETSNVFCIMRSRVFSIQFIAFLPYGRLITLNCRPCLAG